MRLINELKRMFRELIKPHKKRESWSDEVMLMVRRELGLIDPDNCSLDERVLLAQHLINKYPPKGITVQEYEKAVSNLRVRIQSNIDNPPERIEPPQIYQGVIRTYNDLLDAKNNGVVRVRGAHEYTFCKKCRERISRTFFIDDLLEEYRKPIDSAPAPIRIPCSAGATGSDRECFCSWQALLEKPPEVSREFADWMGDLVESNHQQCNN